MLLFYQILIKYRWETVRNNTTYINIKQISHKRKKYCEVSIIQQKTIYYSNLGVSTILVAEREKSGRVIK